MATQAFNTSRSFSRSENGSVAIIFGLMFLGLAMVVGVAIDFARIYHLQSRLVAAADAAALAAGSALLDGRLNDNEIEQLARTYFEKNLEQAGNSFGTVSTPAVTVTRATGQVNIDATATVPMSITKIAGFNQVTVPVNSQTRFDQRDIELGIALDVTGSMRGSKLSDLKAAAKDLVDILLPDGGQPNRVRIGLAPYATSVNAGSYARTVTGRRGGGHTCVHERTGADRFTDAAPTGRNRLGRQNNMSCPTATIVPLTDNKNLLKNTIDSYRANGWTAGHLGASWAWYIVSPLWNSVWPSASRPVSYNTSNTLKVVILMTDGVFNREYQRGSNGRSSQQARSVCSEMKNKGVAVYSIAFQAPGSAQNLLQDCSSGSSYYYSASNGDELRQAFKEIAKQLNNLRLTN
ncbi:MAG: VWA domain-containing protein [Filomicrobium sp.]